MGGRRLAIRQARPGGGGCAARGVSTPRRPGPIAAYGNRTVRAVIVAAVVAFLVALVCTPIAIRVSTWLKAGQPIRSDGPQTHLVKKGTPTMGGVVFIFATVVAYVAG